MRTDSKAIARSAEFLSNLISLNINENTLLDYLPILLFKNINGNSYHEAAKIIIEHNG